MNKNLLRDAIVAQLRSELALQARAAQLARDEATHEESRAKSKYDTHSQEAAYLAEGQARLVLEIDASLAQYATLALPAFAPGSPIALGALIEITEGQQSTWYFLGPRAGGITITVENREILVLTPQSPLGRQFLGKRAGDTLPSPKRGAPPLRIATVE